MMGKLVCWNAQVRPIFQEPRDHIDVGNKLCDSTVLHYVGSYTSIKM